jgi:hypothetical protein
MFSPQTQQAPRMKPGLNLMGEKQVDPRTEQYRKAIDREYDAALKKIPGQSGSLMHGCMGLFFDFLGA